jgi:hypothetical protein
MSAFQKHALMNDPSGQRILKPGRKRLDVCQEF